MLIILVFFVFLLLVFLGMPIAFAIGVTAVLGFQQISVSTLALITRMFGGLDVATFVAIPFFMLAGELMVNSGLLDEVLDLSRYFVGRVRGGLAHADVLACMVFAGIAGSSTAETSAIGSILIPAMKKQGYGSDFAISVTVAASAIGPIIPPSILMIIYSHITGTSIGDMFLGGIIPGILMGVVLMGLNHLICIRRGYDFRAPKANLRKILVSFWKSLPALILPVIIVVGIVGGFVTATESSALAVLYAGIYGLVIRRTVKINDLGGILTKAATTSSVVMLVIAFAIPFGDVLTRLRFQSWFIGLFDGSTLPPTIILLLIVGFLLLLGLVIEATAVCVMFAATLAAFGDALGFHPIHFGVTLVLAMVIGSVTPPVGVSLFIGLAIGKEKMENVMGILIPYVGTLIIALVLVALFPQLVLWIPTHIR
jgi:C4-dicarboxylate transporter DctM subunit